MKQKDVAFPFNCSYTVYYRSLLDHASMPFTGAGAFRLNMAVRIVHMQYRKLAGIKAHCRGRKK